MFGTAVFPATFAALLGWFDWRALWMVSGGFLILTLPVVLWLLKAERTPQSFAEETVSVGMSGKHWTRVEVIRSPLFLFLLPMLLGPPSWGTALFFQQVHIADVKGWDLVEYLALIPLLTFVSAVMTVVSGQLIDLFGSGRLLQIYLIPWSIGFILMAFAETLFAAGLAFVVFGIAMGLQTTTITAFWAEYFGTRHIGAIKATSTSIMVFGSAIGPGITGWLIDRGFNFPEQMLVISVYFLFAMVLVWIAVNRAKRLLSPPV